MSEEKIKKNIFEIQRIYIKDISFESPHTPNIFYLNWKPIIKIDLNTFFKKIEKNIFEIVLQIRVIVKIKDNVVFLCDVHQAGIFFISNLKEDQLSHCLHSYCPNILFPYARECISNLVSRASFPQINIAPINFDSIYFNHINSKKQHK
ncbi:preprotein translocase subunit SecB [Buchnera aphidicola (Diuraphis noxia)]|uniref:Protein-export protein SecB n=1 Tax=Buchnera aphidicola subsp. Diuraphis noxia TaxID=118101 RepID=A0A1B2H9J3_BUCDN|nr:protein-export chaperone SecB [Buchnera aphidicola]ANZ22779.1 preprotein translocase subunit SecB [Buchnera aphidicola (Diuraphis noxia)]